MSFFKKLRERLTRSSSKLSEGVDALVDEAPGAPEAPETTDAAEPDAPEIAEAPAKAERAPDSVPDRVAEPRPAAPPPPRAPAPEPSRAKSTHPEPQRAEPPRDEPPPAPAPAPVPEPVPEPVRPDADPLADPLGDAEAPERRPGLLGRLMGRPAAPRRLVDDDMLESLEELLITADMGVDTALKLSARLGEAHFGQRLTAAEIRGALAKEIAAVLEPVARPLPLYAKRPQVVLVVGVNGSGKTTTIGKLASQLKAAGKRVVIAAGDTFRAAAVEQLLVWGVRAVVPVMTAAQGADPAALAFEAMGRAEAEGADLLLIDTAGRLQNRQDLMDELAKIVRVIRKKDADAPHNTVLVLDATTGQNALGQVDVFAKIADVSGLVMTKLDGTAKGGVLVALADRFGLPIHAIGVGESIDDLSPFDPGEFAAALTGSAA